MQRSSTAWEKRTAARARTCRGWRPSQRGPLTRQPTRRAFQGIFATVSFSLQAALARLGQTLHGVHGPRIDSLAHRDPTPARAARRPAVRARRARGSLPIALYARFLHAVHTVLGTVEQMPRSVRATASCGGCSATAIERRGLLERDLAYLQVDMRDVDAAQLQALAARAAHPARRTREPRSIARPRLRARGLHAGRRGAGGARSPNDPSSQLAAAPI